MFNFKTIVKIIAKNPPSIAIAFGGVMIISGQTEAGYAFLYAGVFLQVLWLIMKKLRKR